MDQTIGRYQVLEEIGSGGMATVYRALDPRFEREVAIKVLPPDLIDEPALRARFAREAKVVASLEHPAIVPVHDFGEEQGQPFLVMRYLRGGSLKDRLESGQFSPEEIAKLTRRLADALDAAHAHNIVHRDVKPGNVLFDEHGNPYLSDFGIVKLGSTATTLTGEGVIGTPAYMSPEQARGARDLNSLSDVYSLGVLSFELLAGRPPFEADTPMGLAVMHVTDPVPDLTDIRSDLPATLDPVLKRAMAKRPTDRYPSAGQFARALSLALAGETVEAEPVEAPVQLPETLVAGEADAPMPTPPPPDSGGGIGPGLGRIPFRWLGAGGLVLVLISLTVFAASQILSRPQPEAPPATRAPSPIAPTEAPVVLPPVEGDPPRDDVAAFYYPWYGNPEVDGGWIHWDGPGLNPPSLISADFYPVLGAYSVNDPAVVAQHFAWLRRAGVGVIISSWWGEGDFTDEAVPLLLEMGERYGIKVAFHIENYDGRSADRLVENLRYLYERYGDHPAFYRAKQGSLWNDPGRESGLFFLWDSYHTFGGGEEVGAEYWRDALDQAHELPDGAIVLAQSTEPHYVAAGHFDGLYTYADLDLDDSDHLIWSRSVPLGGWTVPTVLPGFSARRIGYDPGVQRPRDEGQRYQRQWELVVNGPRQPQMITITSFNEWHEGSQIEPASDDPPAAGEYQRYEGVPPDGYLDLTRTWVDHFSRTEWPPTYRARITLQSTSDWTSLFLIDGGGWLAPHIVAVSDEVGRYELPGSGEIHMNQPLDKAFAGQSIELTVDLLLSELEGVDTLTFRIERGSIGATEVELYNYLGEEPRLVDTLRWAGVVDGDGTNPRTFTLPVAEFTANPGE